jgi:hypothetical protein
MNKAAGDNDATTKKEHSGSIEEQQDETQGEEEGNHESSQER